VAAIHPRNGRPRWIGCCVGWHRQSPGRIVDWWPYRISLSGLLAEAEVAVGVLPVGPDVAQHRRTSSRWFGGAGVALLDQYAADSAFLPDPQ
jgi:hypothetical protein